jgi:hypothetical protein
MARLPPQKTINLGDYQIKYIIKSNCRDTWFALKWCGPTTQQTFLSTCFATRFFNTTGHVGLFEHNTFPN